MAGVNRRLCLSQTLMQACRHHLAARRYVPFHLQQRCATFASEPEKAELHQPLPQKFPYPTHDQPTPHEIFHLPGGATPNQIKERYYELVRSHHPDSPHGRLLSPTLAHSRFRNIKAAYDFLQGHTLSPHPNARPAPSPKNFDPYLHELARRRRANEASAGRYNRRSNWDAGFDPHAPGAGFAGDSGWAKPGWGEGLGAHPLERGQWNPDGRKERLILACGVVAVLAGLFPRFPAMMAELFFPGMFVSQDEKDPTEAASLPGESAVAGDLARTAPEQVSSFGFPNPFSVHVDKTHRDAVAALQQARHERGDIGPERREGVRRRVREMRDGEENCQTDDNHTS